MSVGIHSARDDSFSYLSVAMSAAWACFAQSAEYTEYLAKAKDYEAKKQYVYALGNYWDAMVAEPTENALEAVDAYDKLAAVIKSGKPGEGEFDDFDLYDGWVDIYKDFEAYWTENSTYVFSISDLKKGELDMSTRTATYNASISYGTSKKYDAIRSIVQGGIDESRRREWNEVPSSIGNALDSKKQKITDFYIQLGIKGTDGTVLVKGDLVQMGRYSTDYAFKSVDRNTIKILDAGGVSIVPVAVSYKNEQKPLSVVKFTVKGGQNTDVNAPVSVKMAQYTGVVLIKDAAGDFYIQKTEVMSAQYEAVTGRNPSSYSWDLKPVQNVSWYDAIVFCNTLSVQQGLTPCYSVKGSTDVSTWDDYEADDVVWNQTANGWRLPTEKEWELAANDGHKYSGSDNIDEVAWYSVNSGYEPHNVATKKPNAKGIYDMSGNVCELCYDKYSSSSSYRVYRGGSWYSSKSGCTVSYRGYYDASYRDYRLGFRVVRSAY